MAVSVSVLMKQSYSDSFWHFSQLYIGHSDFGGLYHKSPVPSTFIIVFTAGLFSFILPALFISTESRFVYSHRQSTSNDESWVSVRWAQFKESVSDQSEYLFFRRFELDKFFKFYLPGIYYRVIVEERLFQKRVEEVMSERVQRRRTALVGSVIADQVISVRTLDAVREATEELKDRVNDMEAEFANELREFLERLDRIDRRLEG
jgi:hypothetical protein